MQVESARRRLEAAEAALIAEPGVWLSRRDRSKQGHPLLLAQESCEMEYEQVTRELLNQLRQELRAACSEASDPAEQKRSCGGKVGDHSVGEMDGLVVPPVMLFSDEDSPQNLTAFLVSSFGDRLGVAPTQTQVKEISDAVIAMLQSPPRHRTVTIFLALLRDPDVLSACSSTVRDSEAMKRFECRFR